MAQAWQGHDRNTEMHCSSRGDGGQAVVTQGHAVQTYQSGIILGT